MSELERHLIGKLTDGDNIAKAYHLGVRTEQFEEPICQAVWQFCVNYWRDSRPQSAPTAWAISEEFPGFDLVDNDDDISWLAAKLVERFAANRLQEIIRDVAVLTTQDPVAAMAQLRTSSLAASESMVKRVNRVNLADTVEEREHDYEERESHPEGLGVPYGLPLIDAHTGGLIPGELAIVGAVAKTGKTMFLAHVAADAVKRGLRVIFFTLEMSIKEVSLRIDAMFSGVSYDRLIHGKLTPAERELLRTSRYSLAELGGIQIEMPDLDGRTAQAVVARAREYAADYIVIDQLSHMEPGRRVGNLKEHHAVIVKALSGSINTPGEEVPCLLAAQLRRGDEELSIESFANAAEIEREADIMFGLSRNRDLRENHAMRVDILGSRRSDIGAFLLGWELQSATQITTLDRIRQ